MQSLTKNWWFLLITGILFILFGTLITFYPKEALLKMMFLFGLVFLLCGIIIMSLALMNKKKEKSWQGLMVFAAVDILLGLFFMIFQSLALKLLVYLIGIWAILVGIFQFIHYFQLPGEMRKRSVSPYIGGVAVILGTIMLLAPTGTGVFMTILTGILCMGFGVMMVGISLRWKRRPA